MKSKQLFTLVVITAALVAGALFMHRSEQPNTPVLGTLLFPDLKLNDITRVEITSASGKTVLTRKDDTWVSESRYGYPIRFDTLRSSLMVLSKLTSSQPVPLTDEQRKTMHLIPPTTNNPAESGTLVSWSYGPSAPAGSIIIGQEHHKNVPGVSEQYGGYPDGQFIAVEPSGDAYLIPELLEGFTPAPENWLETDLINIGPEKVKQVTMRYAGSQDTLTLPRREGTKALMVTDVKKKEQEVSEKLTSIGAALSYFTLADVADPTLTDDAMGFTNSAGFDAQTEDGIQYTVTIGKKRDNSDQTYVRVSAAALPSTNVVAASTNAPGTNMTPPVVTGPTPEQVAKDFNAKFGKWTFLMPSYKIDPLQMKRTDLVTKKDDDADKSDKKDEDK